ncbi:LPP20 family lipoprotein [Photobacterium alginatilyticum]|jgi:hypothetical protein|uniref:LPP20 family lipoprotein n=1 Tax=Photobacterium alginatilyticum TaxID=1775171 RepID=UPI0040693147
MKKILALSALSIALVGCQSTKQEAPVQAKTNVQPVIAECYFYGKPELAAPNWICNPNANREEFIREAVGFSGDTAGGIAHQKNLAILQAKKELADQVKSEIISKVKNKTGTLGVNGSAGASAATSSEMEAIANVELEGVEIIRSFRGPDGYFYVHAGLPRNVFKQNIENIVTAVNTQAPAPEQQQVAVAPQSSPAQNKKLADEIAQALGEM